MYKPLPKCLTIDKSSIHGLGLFAAEDIPSETEFGISHVKDARFQDSYIRTPLGGFFNHSNSPNCKVVEEGDCLKLVSIGDIKAGEEISVKYTLYNPTKKGKKPLVKPSSPGSNRAEKLCPNDPIEW
jgi:SET domain-containing protein